MTLELHGDATELVSACLRLFAEATSSPERALDLVVERVAVALRAFCIVSLPDETGEALVPMAYFDTDPERGRARYELAKKTPARLDAGIAAARAFREGAAVLVAAPDEAFFRTRFPDPEEFAKARRRVPREILIVPLRARGASLGTFTLIREAETEAFSSEERRLAEVLAGHAALAIQNARLIRSLQDELRARERAQAELAANERRLRAIMDAAEEGVWVTDAERRTTFVNRRMAEMMRESPETMLGSSARDYSPPEQRATNDQRFERRKSGIAERVEVTLRRKDGTEFDARIAVSALTDESGRFGGAVGLVTDVSENRSLEGQLRQARRMEAVGRLAGGVAHDFNNILTAILGLSHVAKDSLPESHPARKDLAEIQRAADRGSALTRQILAFSRKQILQPTIVEPNLALTKLLPMLARVLGEHIEMRTVFDTDVGRIRVDPNQFEQAILNLAVNARDAMPAGGRLTFTTANVDLDQEFARTHAESSVGPHVLVAVTDTGHGMNQETMDRIFEPFFTTKEVGKGTGLGLSTVHGIVRQSGGNVWVYSEVGAGTTIEVYLPRTDEPAVVEPVRSVLPPPRRGGATILLVEDDEMVRQTARTVLWKAGYRVLTASRPSDAIALAKSHSGTIDLVITDLVMPEMPGNQLASRLVQDRPSTRVLFMSGYAENTAVQEGVVLNGMNFLAKPISADRLLRKVDDVLVA